MKYVSLLPCAYWTDIIKLKAKNRAFPAESFAMFFLEWMKAASTTEQLKLQIITVKRIFVFVLTTGITERKKITGRNLTKRDCERVSKRVV